ncbi:hypothetical protein OG883_46470 [Streptomyces sp. NBC_01142]|uniref:hypothetical protein n=1 Tax=Streptomyces sp. NBC_01142 TaxID=2975865 RepID=UPI00225852E0|nr:hypothetical protein [Streptomyces sp. NBC_01142]MCX4827087.1 hypothetical protein [Streptomyces sp. NBC_01142]
MPHLALPTAAHKAPAVDRGRAETRLFIAPYADESISDVKVLFDAHGRVRYADERPSDRCVDGYLWERWEGTQTGGQRWSEHHPQRQRHVMRQPPRCGGCSGGADLNERGMLWLLNANAGTEQLTFPRDIITATPPMCVPDAHRALRFCRVLREGFIAVRARVAEPIGVKGTVYSPSVPPQEDQLVLFDDSRMDRVVARQVILKLYDAEQDTTTLPTGDGEGHDRLHPHAALVGRRHG